MNVTEKFISLHQSLMALFHDDGFIDRGRENKLKNILLSCAQQLAVTRVSIWVFNATKDQIHCELLLSADDNKFSSGKVLYKCDYPGYFEAIADNRLINADRAVEDPRTSCFATAHLIPNDIKSMLDAPIFLSGTLFGVLCLEQRGQFRQWDVAELSYAAAVADTISLINEHERWMNTREQLEFLEYTDSLTGLENRRFFKKRIARDLLETNDRSTLSTLILLGLDFYTKINDTHGEKSADHVLSTLAERYLELPSKIKCYPARIGGDVFGFWLPEIENQAQLARILDSIKSRTNEAIMLPNGAIVEVSASVGVVIDPKTATEVNNPIRCAELAMIKAKKQQRGGVEYFSSDWLEQLKTRQAMEDELMNAFEQQQLRAHYQPILSAGANEVVGIEALVRWQHPQKGLIPPFQFLPLVAQMGLMSRLGNFMLRQACQDINLLRQSGVDIQWISVNLSSEQLYSATLVQEIEQLLTEHNLSSSSIHLEIVEELISQDSDMVRSQLTALDELGVKLSIDDFGTGYSSLSRLKYLPVSKLKIDKSFVDGLPGSEDDQCIARSIIGLAKGMKVDLVAEGVELAEQAKWLTSYGCDYLQGYLYSKPMPLDELIAFCTKPRADTETSGGGYHIKINKKVLDISVYGQWDGQTVARLFSDLARHMAILKHQSWAVLIDTTQWQVNTIEVQNALATGILNVVDRGLSSAAYVLGESELAKYQIELISPKKKGYQRQFFSERRKAVDWLEEQGFDME